MPASLPGKAGRALAGVSTLRWHLNVHGAVGASLQTVVCIGSRMSLRETGTCANLQLLFPYVSTFGMLRRGLLCSRAMNARALPSSRYALRAGEIDELVIRDGVFPLPATKLATDANPADLAPWL